VANLRNDRACRPVVPDLNRTLVQPPLTRLDDGGRPDGGQHAGLCPTDPAKPQLEPVALGLTHDRVGRLFPHAQTAAHSASTARASRSPSSPTAWNVDQPDFIRADGSHVITDYQDFTGDGINADSTAPRRSVTPARSPRRAATSMNLDVRDPAHPRRRAATSASRASRPGASIVALKIFGNALLTAPTSTIIQAIDYAVNVAHVDVINDRSALTPTPTRGTTRQHLQHDAVRRPA